MTKRFSIGRKGAICRAIWSVTALMVLALNLSGQGVTPTLATLSPSSAAAGAQSVSLTVLGANFQSGAAVHWNQIPLTTAFFIGTTQVTAIVPAILLSAPGTASITVLNPGGVRSNALIFSVTGSTITIGAAAVPAGAVGSAYTFAFSASGGTAPYTWTLTGSLPAGLTLSSDGVISGTPTASGTFTATAQVTDAANQTAVRTFTIVIAAPSLVITPPSPLPRGVVGQSYRQTLTAANGTPPYRWTVGQGLPAGLTLEGSSGTLSGTPTATGTFSFPVRVTDARDVSTTATFELTIGAAPLVITTVSPLFNGNVGSPYAQTLSASGGVPPYRWAILSGDSGDLTLDANTGVLQGTPRAAGTLSLVIRVTDNNGTVASGTFSIVINPPTLTIPTASTLPNGSAGVSYTQTFSVVGGTAPYTWSLMSGSVPGLALDPATATLSGTPTTAGTYSLTLQVRDVAGASATRTFTVTINSSVLKFTNDSQLSDATLAAPFSQLMTATGGVAPYTWSATGLPEGLTIDATTGLISGTPAAAGSYSFTVRVTDSGRVTIIDLFRISVNLPSAPSATVSGLPGTADPARQFALRISLNETFPAPISGQAILSFAPDTGGGDNTIQFSSGGRIADFTIAADTLEAVSATPLAIQTGTVAGTITVTLRLRAGGIDITPSQAPTARTRVDRTAPVIRSARLVRSGNTFGIEITGSSTAREVTQATFTFSAATGQSLQNSTVTVPVEDLFSKWFQDPSSGDFGSQFVFTQTFNIQGDANAVIPQTVTLTNRLGSVTANVTQ